MRKFVLILTAMTGLSAPALAKDICMEHPKSEWMSKAQFQEHVEGLGYKIKNIKEEDGCWEMYGYNKDGDRVEIYFDPKTGDIVKQKN